MTKRDYQITDAVKGTALAIRIVPGANCDEIGEIFSDGSVEVRLKAADDDDLNAALVQFLASFLEIWPADVEVLAGHEGVKKLVTIMNVISMEVEQKLFEATANSGC